ncbi:M1 family metallopeptidase [Lacticaseibacillus kribbianus]|uniref:M1 family metallopeptidase n=1 Tax=Lacticaseibacillus kribbianus TaxID=2926292 RepID=UPI001CD2A9CC|nr:M1 family metallopeptidase [Lacticaseibacillus kribbianus]
MTATKHLYETFQPTHYDLYLDVDRQTKLIAGKTTVSGHATEAEIRLNQKDLTVSGVTADGAAVPFTTDNAAQTLTITLPAAGDVTLTVDYTAPLTDTMMGIYPSYYEIDGVKKQLIGTQFETTAARQAFPGVDEPEAKATFDLAIKFDEQPGETVIANMPEIKEEGGVHYFDTTRKMSTYLVAFAFGDMQKKLTKTNSGVEIGVFTTKAHKPEELDFALDIAKRSIEFYEDFYQTPYPLPHSYQLGLPDFSAGAMENWGLVTYREAYLTLDPSNSTLRQKQLIATVIAHELAHQWFGDLVTMKWWDDLWLNESFANMMEFVAIDALEPDWHIWETFQTGDAPSALRRDATPGVQSVHMQVEDPAEIDALFDGAIVYAKGARMLVMVRGLIGDDALRTGLKAYFDAHQYGNAAGADLWAALGKAAGIDLGAIMHGWLEQSGYPVVTASVIDGKLTLSQKQFFIGDGEDTGRLWQIPLNGSYATPQLMTTATLELGDYQALRDEAGKPFRLNVGNESHFIVKYDATLLADLLATAQDLDPISQLQLLQDQRLLAEGRQLSYAKVVPLLTQFAGSTSAVVLSAVFGIANMLKKFTAPDSAEEKALKALFTKLTAAHVARLGWAPVAGEANNDQLARPQVLSAALYAGDPATVAGAHEAFAKVAEPKDLPANTRPYILASEIRWHASVELFDKLLRDYRTSADPNYKEAIAYALTDTQDSVLIGRLIDAFEDADTIKPQDLRGWYAGVLANPVGQQAAWDWLRTEWSWLEKTVGGDMEFTTYITVSAGRFYTPERLAEFKAFFEPKKNVPGLGREIEMDTKAIAGRVDLIAAEAEAVNAAVADAIK